MEICVLSRYKGRFVNRLTSPEHSASVCQFNNVLLGLASLYRQGLIGGMHRGMGEYNAEIREDLQHFVSSEPINFRTLLLSAFKRHGGSTNADVGDQYVVYVEISRESASDILTVRRFLRLIEEQLRPSLPGCPRHVVVGGDQPSYKMFVDLWLESWRASRRCSNMQLFEESPQSSASKTTQLHERLVPFPRLFYAEKQAMYALCKQMLDGVGLNELAACAGLSQAQVSNILSHSHARNNRAVLFNLCCAFVVHLTDMLLFENVEIAEGVLKMHATASAKKVNIVSTSCLAASRATIRSTDTSTMGSICKDNDSIIKGALFRQTTDIVTADVVFVGRAIRQGIQKHFATGL